MLCTQAAVCVYTHLYGHSGGEIDELMGGGSDEHKRQVNDGLLTSDQLDKILDGPDTKDPGDNLEKNTGCELAFKVFAIAILRLRSR